jgi:hypothetical protein
MSQPAGRHTSNLIWHSDGTITLHCSCGRLLATYIGAAPYADVNAKVMTHGFQVLGEALATALAPVLNPPSRRDFRLVPPPLPPLRLSQQEKEE